MSNFIHPTAIVEENVSLGSNNFIGPFCRISGRVEIGNNNYFDSYVSIGSPPQDDMLTLSNHLSYLNGKNIFGHDDSIVRIGSGNFFREFVTVHSPLLSLTAIGNDCYFMTHSHIPHDAIIHNRVKLANSTQLGGFTVIQSDAYLGLATTVLQFSVIGGMAMVGMNSTVSRNIYPGSLVAGSPAKTVGPNLIKLNRYFGSSEWWQNLKDGIPDVEIPPNFTTILEEFEELKRNTSQRKIDLEKFRSNFK